MIETTYKCEVCGSILGDPAIAITDTIGYYSHKITMRIPPCEKCLEDAGNEAVERKEQEVTK
jgi:hypothetical protein